MKYDYNEVLRKYKELSLEKGRPLTLEEVDKINELPSSDWFYRQGGIERLRYKLGLGEDNTFCKDCAYNPKTCGHKLENCPLKNEADLYYSDIGVK